jgi:hypothetical protein
MNDDFESQVQQESHGVKIFHEVKTIEQGKAYVLELVRKVENARDLCDVVIPGDKAATVRHQKKAYRSWMIRYGQALGALTTLMHCRVLNDVAYEELRVVVTRTAIPTLMGSLWS